MSEIIQKSLPMIIFNSSELGQFEHFLGKVFPIYLIYPAPNPTNPTPMDPEIKFYLSFPDPMGQLGFPVLIWPSALDEWKLVVCGDQYHCQPLDQQMWFCPTVSESVWRLLLQPLVGLWANLWRLIYINSISSLAGSWDSKAGIDFCGFCSAVCEGRILLSTFDN